MPSRKFTKRRSKFASKFKPRVTVAVKKYVKRAIKQEIELKSCGYETGAVSATDAIHLFGILHPERGLLDNQRIADKIRYKSLFINFSFADADTTNLCRFIVFQWLDNSSSALPADGTILLNGAGDFPVYSPYNHNTKQAYKILYDHTCSLSESGNGVYHKQIIIRKFHPSSIQFTDGEGGLVNNVIKGQIFCYIMSDSAAPSHPQFIASITSYYTDA